MSCICPLEAPQHADSDIWMCEHHIYYRNGVRYTSVSAVKKAILPEDYAAVDPAVLENARVKGSYIDTYFSEYWLRDRTGMMDLDEFRDVIEPQFSRDKYADPAKHADDARHRLEMLMEWWDKSSHRVVDTQAIVYSDADQTAGTYDIGTQEFIIDLKLVSKLQPNYELQLGAYLAMDKQEFPKRDVAILHVTKEKVRFVQYDSKRAKEAWRSAVAWYHTMKRLTA